MSKNINILWFRKDLRLNDNPALVKANLNSEILPIYILDTSHSNESKMGSASKVWLHHSLKILNNSLDNKLNFYKGDPIKIINKLVQSNKINGIYWNSCYEQWEIKRDKEIKKKLTERGIQVKSYNGSLIREPWEVLKEDKTPYKVFTALYKKAYLFSDIVVKTLKKPIKINFLCKTDNFTSLDSLKLLPKLSWASNIIKNWKVGEEEANLKADNFFTKGILI